MAGEISHIFAESRNLFIDHPDTILALLGSASILGGLAAWALSSFSGRIAFWQSRRAWRIALRTETEYLLEVVDELKGNISERGYSFKRLNDDFLADARLKGYSFDVNSEFIKRLAHVFRDVVHTNGVLDRSEETKGGYSGSASSSLDTVGCRLKVLQSYIDRKLLRFWHPRKYRKEDLPPIPPQELPPPSIPVANKPDQETGTIG